MANFELSTEVNSNSSGAESLLRPLVTCSICLGLYVDPVALLDCLHIVCGACAVEWLDQSSSCPQCRESVRGARDSHHTAAIVEAYKNIAPDSNLCQERTPEELVSLRDKYCPGQLTTRNPQRNDYPSSDDDDDDSDGELDFGNTNPSRYYPMSQLQRSRILPNRIREPDSACFSCDPNNSTGYVCPQPCLAYDHHTIPPGHTTCGSCARFLPLREDRPKCTVCTRTTCSELNQECRAPEAQQFTPLKDVEFPPGWTFPLTHAFGENNYEREAFRGHLASGDMTLQGLFSRVIAFRGPEGLPRARWQGPGFPPHDSRLVSLDDKVCVHCALDLLEGSLFDWWVSERPAANLPEEVRNREDCWYGIDCRTARHNPTHARNLNHICHPTRGGDEPQQNPPENGNRVVVGEARTIDVIFPAYSPSEVTFRDMGNETVFMCSSVYEDETGEISIIPGKMTVWGERGRTLVYYGMDGVECWHDETVQMLKDVRNMRWVRTSKGVVPTGCNPVVGGHKTIEGSREVLHHCAVWWCGQRVPGYTSPRTGRAVITWAGEEWYLENEYELLCWN